MKYLLLLFILIKNVGAVEYFGINELNNNKCKIIYDYSTRTLGIDNYLIKDAKIHIWNNKMIVETYKSNKSCANSVYFKMTFLLSEESNIDYENVTILSGKVEKKTLENPNLELSVYCNNLKLQ